MDEQTIDVAVVGLGFGEDFIPLYADHPRVGTVAIVDPSADRLREVGERHGIQDRYRSLDEVLEDERWDAVHVVAPVSFHAEYSVAVLEAGKHCACAVPMATELEDLRAVVEAQRRSGRNYMMMETSVYGREYLLTEQMYRSGELGGLTMYRGYHVQDLDGYPGYWQGYPPMKYVTHALSPALALTGRTVADVVAHGTGRLTPDRVGPYGNPFPAQVGLFRLADSDLVADITMSFFQTARSYVEGFSVYGDSRSVEWSGAERDPVRVFELLPLDPGLAGTGLRGRRSRVIEVVPPDVTDRLPSQLARYVTDYELVPENGGPAATMGAHHGGSHPHLVEEFVTSIVDGRPPRIDAVTAAAWTAPGIVAHESAMLGGERLAVPTFECGP